MAKPASPPRLPRRHPGASRPAKSGPSPHAQTPGSKHQILDAALGEFAERGFAGARVDRISAAAGLNKAMLYYHFGSKEGLYRATIQGVVDRLADRLEAIVASPLDPRAKLDAYIESFVSLGLSEPRFAPIMLREVTEGAVRLDEATVQHLVRVVKTMGAIVGEGRRSGEFRDVNPLLAYLTTVWPIMIYLASGPARATILRHSAIKTSDLEPASFVRHMQDVSRRTLCVHPDDSAPRTTARSREHAS